MPSPDCEQLGVCIGANGGTIRVTSRTATGMEVVLYDRSNLGWEIQRVPLARESEGVDSVWSATSTKLLVGTPYTLSVSGPAGPQNAFSPKTPLLDPYARGLARAQDGSWRAIALGSVVGGDFEWGGSSKPRTPLEATVIYEAHLRGFSKLNQGIPEALRGTYAGLAHDASLSYLTNLGVTAVELLPVHAFVSEQRLVRQGRVNYWGYNTLGFFAPHAPYASASARAEGAHAVRREFAGMVRRLHEAGLEVILDVVYNHTAEEGPAGPVYSFRGIDNATYYRQDSSGHYLDTTGCGNTLNTSEAVVQELILDSLRYFADELQVDGFRLDLATTLGRDASANYTPDHPLLRAMATDPVIGAGKLIAEPWDVGHGGWQTGHFTDGFSEWNDNYRDRVRKFWLSDLRQERQTGAPSEGIGNFATELAGSSSTFPAQRGPLASLNFVTAHDGFTIADLVTFDTKHNLGNGEDNRDGTDNNHSYNHGVEGDTTDPAITTMRRRSIRNLLGTLLLSAGVPMLVAGDEFGRTQRGNNNAYCQDTELTWLPWADSDRDASLAATTRLLLRFRRENRALRPQRYGTLGEHDPEACQMDWYNAEGNSMSIDDWNNPSERTLQYLASAEPEIGHADGRSDSTNDHPDNANSHPDSTNDRSDRVGSRPDRVLLVVHAHDSCTDIVLPTHDGVAEYELLWDSSEEFALDQPTRHRPGDKMTVREQSMRLFRVHP
ncbi:MAG: glycogen debranching enzyme GlgX [Candidatus Lumbricidophila eiseniae]|uniref:Glycogen debranching enzyme GlgX n=1 Tax=Candidatus Lumbricidiphila eiseniae TaxID=1969409 RepID=A0A2A6FQF0_9MICO|nr:MAG: glycogen debranching enzyme GlgX [Candidatus Lumbricidophila eiseniae]